ncbi:MAG: UTP--glucose-1-phosphate uridylyltransferase [Candidatus Cloacimonetes bacterium]|nr:UTP--glucose-1-phosphate uridylyltransferase [Candidatus Cloacimonadota bacterium]
MNYLEQFTKKMNVSGINHETIQVFSHYYNQFINGEKGKLGKNNIILPNPEQVIDYEGLQQDVKLYPKDMDITSNLRKLAIIKLNGGLGTSMGLSKAKSLLPVKDDDTFLDIIVKQTLKMREKFQIELPLIFMNSFNTSEDTIDFLKKYPEMKISGLPLEFIQNMFPKVRKDNFQPLESSIETMNWNPPGHGDIYNALSSSGLLQNLINKGFEYIFVSNSDNLGAVVDPKILTMMIEKKIDFAMEVCNRTEMDKKGGHLASTLDGKLVLREVAQCPDEEIEEFQNVEIYKYFNTNNLWINLQALQKKMIENDGVLPLPLILNEKKVDNTSIYQFETAMGAAISVFNNSKAFCVPRNRFLPVKKNQDLLLLWSDSYMLNKDYCLVKKEGAKNTILELDNDFYGNIEQLKTACEEGIPSLYDCDTLKIKGFVKFHKDQVFKGEVELVGNDSM